MNSDIERRIANEVRVEDFPVNFQPIARAIGIEDALTIVKLSGGVNQYIPKYDVLINAARERVILQEFTGYNYRELALKYNLSEVWVRNIVDKDKTAKARDQLIKNQTQLFEESS